jgi:flagellar basal-body rod protein FlgG
MIRGFYTARTGLTAHQARLDTIANNMANVSTTGFKPMRTAFKDLIYQNLNRPEAEDTANVGHGVKMNKNDILMQQGAPTPTGRDLDFCLTEENAFFALETATGEIRYTRNGNFALANADDAFYLVGSNGDRVLNIDEEAFEVEMDENGQYTVTAEDLAVYSFPNPLGLWSMEGTTFSPTPESGEGELLENPAMMSGYLENSAVEIAYEMTNMIEANRAFSFNARMVQTADEVEQIVNTLRQ